MLLQAGLRLRLISLEQLRVLSRLTLYASRRGTPMTLANSTRAISIYAELPLDLPVVEGCGSPPEPEPFTDVRPALAETILRRKASCAAGEAGCGDSRA